jgi:hypothetical protein
MRMKVFLRICLALLALGAAACGPAPAVKAPNRLLGSASPYLRQHAFNPVAWQPWDDSAWQAARSQQRLVIISIGYAACHWCHVMERETFEDTAAAGLMNRHFISLKVDRHERPDLDAMYMPAALLSSGQGGWPLNVIALPDGRPLFAATYLPRERWMGLIAYYQSQWEQRPEVLLALAGELARGVRQAGTLPPSLGPAWDAGMLHAAAAEALATMDSVHGGLRQAQKFPLPPLLSFLMQYAAQTGDSGALGSRPRQQLLLTLRRMAQGGLYDHLGGGFFRYSSDSLWRVPHFEKMLYDNAQLLELYAAAARWTGDSAWLRIADETAAFLLREMQAPDGRFFAALDADTDGQEGKYYAWKEKDIVKTLGMDAYWFKELYGITPFGNWQQELNLLYRAEPESIVAAHHQLDPTLLRRQERIARLKLLAARYKREAPARDSQLIAGWNGLMVNALLEAWRASGRDTLHRAALRCGEALLAMSEADGRLWRLGPQGKQRVAGFADDYAFAIRAWLALFEATQERRWLDAADRAAAYCLSQFQDPESKLLYYSSDSTGFARPRPSADEVMPSASAVMAQNLQRLSLLTPRLEYAAAARQMLDRLKPQILAQPPYHGCWLSAAARELLPAFEIIIVGPDHQKFTEEMRRPYLPQALILGSAQGDPQVPLYAGKYMPGKTLIYICRNRSCRMPLSSPAEALEEMRRVW